MGLKYSSFEDEGHRRHDRISPCGFHQIGELKLQKNIEEMKRGVSEAAFSFTEGGRRFGES